MAIDPSIYATQRRAQNNQFAQQTAMNALGRFVSQQRGNRQTADYTRDWKRQAPSFTASYGQRGLAGAGVQSGVYGNAMRNYAGDYSQNLNRMYADQQSNLNQYDMNQANYKAEHESALADIEANKAREIANAAAALRALKGQFA